MKTQSNCRVLAILLGAGLSASTLHLPAAERAAPTTPAAPKTDTVRLPQTVFVTGKVFAVDRTAKTITVEINEKMCLFRVRPTTTFTREEQASQLADVLPGQEITLAIRESGPTDVELVSVAILLSAEEAEAAGAGKSGKTPPGLTRRPPLPTNRPPVPQPYNPPPLLSPYR